jgi:hypothetical protein
VGLPASHKPPRSPWYSGSTTTPGSCVRVRDSHPLWCAVPGRFLSTQTFTRDARMRHRRCPTTPTLHRTRPVPQCSFRLFPFRSPLLRESRLISCPPGTKMVQFPGFISWPYSLQTRIPPHDGRQVAPFGNLWITACLRLPTAFRSSPRPSSPQRAKASTVCAYFP